MNLTRVGVRASAGALALGPRQRNPDGRRALVQLDELSRPGRRKYCVTLLDFDHFKQLNDEYGHSCGDQVLSAVGRELNRGVRQADTIARWGGEEFLVLLPDTGIEDATRLMDRVRGSGSV